MAPYDTPSPSTPGEDSTLGGYLKVHDRPPAYEGPDGHPYTVSPEVEKTSNLRAPYSGYLVFLRWASTGLGIVGHVETPTLCECGTAEESMRTLGELSLLEVQDLLAEALRRRAAASGE
jgi:hypothetical protein